MKLYALLAVLVLAVPATTFADRKGSGSSRGYSHSHGGRGHSYGGSSHRGHYHGGAIITRSYAPYYGSRYYGYGSGYGYGYGGYYSPSVVLSYSSTPRYYRDAGADYSGSLEMDVQQALRRRGYYRGAVDGDIGPASRSAIRNYQADRGFAATGRIDSSLLRSLGL